MEQANDHDNLVTLIADVKNLTKSQLDFHKEMKEAMTDLKNNYSARLDSHETRLSNLETTRVDFREKLNNNRTYQNFIIGLGLLILGLLLWHITGGFHL